MELWLGRTWATGKLLLENAPDEVIAVTVFASPSGQGEEEESDV